MNNIADGFESKKGSKEFAQFLYIAKGSVAETRSMLYLAVELEYISRDDFNNARDLCIEISRLLYV